MNFEMLVAAVEKLDPVQGVTLLNVYDLPEALVHILTEVMRGRSLSVVEFAEVLGFTAVEGEQLGDLLADKGFLQARTQVDLAAGGQVKIYRVQFERPKRRNMSSKVWDKLDLGS